jgi:hypothetical protein
MNNQEPFEPPAVMIKAANILFYVVITCITVGMFAIVTGIAE